MSEKNFKLAIATPTTGFSRTIYTFSLAKLIFYFTQHSINGYDQRTLDYYPIETSGISASREKMVEDSIKEGFSHILFIDEDMGFEPNTLHILASRKKEIVGCNYSMRVRGKGFTALALSQEKRIQTTEESTGLEECYYTGFGFCLLDLSIFKRLPQPWFLIGYDLIHKRYSTEDGAFGRKLKDASIPWYVDHDASKGLVHWGGYPYKYKDALIQKGFGYG